MTLELVFLWNIPSFSLIQVSFLYLEIKEISFKELNFRNDIRVSFYLEYTLIFLNQVSFIYLEIKEISF